MEKYEVVFAETAISDLEELVYYISDELQNPAAALRISTAIKTAVHALEEFPKRHSLISDSYLAARGIRLIPIENYLVFYTVEDSARTVSIVRILYGKREWEKLL